MEMENGGAAPWAAAKIRHEEPANQGGLIFKSRKITEGDRNRPRRRLISQWKNAIANIPVPTGSRTPATRTKVRREAHLFYNHRV